MVCTSLGSLLRPLLYFLCSILFIHRVELEAKNLFLDSSSRSHAHIVFQAQHPERGSNRTEKAQGLQDYPGEALENPPAPEAAQSATGAAAAAEAEFAPPPSPRGHAQQRQAASRAEGKEATAAASTGSASAPEESGPEEEENGNDV